MSNMSYQGRENEYSIERQLNEGRAQEPKGEKKRWQQYSNTGESLEPIKEKAAIPYRQALESYDRRLLHEPLNSNLHVGKGEALLGLGRPQEALDAYEEAIRLAPNLSKAYRERGKVYEQLAQQVYEDLTQQAQKCYEKAKQLGVG